MDKHRLFNQYLLEANPEHWHGFDELMCETYAAGDVVIYNDTVYKFDSAHTGAWSGSDATAVTLETLIDDAEPEELTSAQVTTLIGLLG